MKGCEYAFEDIGFYPPEDFTAYAKNHVILGYLSPTDYHRFHAPMSGKCIYCKMEDADRQSASVKFFGGSFNILNKNKRLIIVLEEKNDNGFKTKKDHSVKRIALVIIGGVGVNTIVYKQAIVGEWIEKGSELGTFKAGGSAFCLFSNHPLKLDPKLQDGNRIRMEQHVGEESRPMEVIYGESLAGFAP